MTKGGAALGPLKRQIFKVAAAGRGQRGSHSLGMTENAGFGSLLGLERPELPSSASLKSGCVGQSRSRGAGGTGSSLCPGQGVLLWRDNPWFQHVLQMISAFCGLTAYTKGWVMLPLAASFPLTGYKKHQTRHQKWWAWTSVGIVVYPRPRSASLRAERHSGQMRVRCRMFIWHNHDFFKISVILFNTQVGFWFCLCQRSKNNKME